MCCIPNVVEISAKKLEENVSQIQKFFNIDFETLKNYIFEYPILISSFTSDLNKLEFYFKLYLDMTHDDLVNLVKKFPLLLTAKVIYYFTFK
jgi:hypothetical protein